MGTRCLVIFSKNRADVEQNEQSPSKMKRELMTISTVQTRRAFHLEEIRETLFALVDLET